MNGSQITVNEAFVDVGTPVSIPASLVIGHFLLVLFRHLPFFLTDLLSLRLVGAAGARINVRSSYSQ